MWIASELCEFNEFNENCFFYFAIYVYLFAEMADKVPRNCLEISVFWGKTALNLKSSKCKHEQLRDVDKVVFES